MMISLTARVYDPDGWVVLDVAPAETRTKQRRVTKTGTLDGGQYIDDLGFSPSDVDFVFKINTITEAQAAVLDRLVSMYSLVNCSTRDGFFSGVIQKVAFADKAVITFMVKDKIE
ncbi:MAG: hypothetical protein HQL74_07300 [Magnetococcales bacterium]|nr:hypothetical protein [Magnetococcales bacterium]